MAAVGEVGVYVAPTDIQAGDPQILARVGPGTQNAAIVTGVSGEIVNLRVFPDQQMEFSIRDMTTTEDPVKGTFVPIGGTMPAGAVTRTKTTVTGAPKPLVTPARPVVHPAPQPPNNRRP